ncbi:MAG: macro domain-containing protein [Nitrososphaerota archaeon]|nr:macro domain-containing protein [Nitrososphaerota archaeon]
MRQYELPGGVRLRVYVGDITKEQSDAIVVPANSLMLMGGGVAGAVKRAGGQAIEDEARRKAPVPVGEAVVTSPGRLSCRMVVHAPTMERPAGETDERKVYAATLAALKSAEAAGAASVSFPGMGTGVGGLDPAVAGRAMCRAVIDHASSGGRIRVVNFVAFNEELLEGLVRGVEEVASRGV